nr:cytochrome ubiquinol oxidase subunit I [Bacilli bacterium]
MSGVQQFLSHFFITGPFEIGGDVSIGLVSIAILFILTRYKLWGWLWREWLTSVDHKKIGIMYLLAALLMLFRGGVDALMIRTQLAIPGNSFLQAEHYDQIFTTHGTIMILFMAMPFIFAMMNIVVPLQIGARDVAFPYLNAISFWLFFFGAMLLNISFVIGGSPDAGWVNYPPLAELRFSPGPGDNFYLLSIMISGIGSVATGINFLVTILKMRAPGMTLMRMPMFSWAILATCIDIIFAFPALTIALGLEFMDRMFGAHFFTVSGGGNPMMYVNLFWMWGHPEVYIVILPAFGIFSEIVPTFARKKLFGYTAMVTSLLLIAIISYFVWLHHFFTMGAGADVNTFFAIASMFVAIPTGVKVFNWLFTMYRGRIRTTIPMLWFLAFVPNFAIGGATGVMLAAAPADYQYHNSYFLVAHFHQVLIGGVVYGMLAGMYYWWPKMFGILLEEKWAKWGYWFFNIGFYVCFMPQYPLGLMGMTRRMYTYPAGMGWTTLNQISTVGAFIMGLGFIFIVWGIVTSILHPVKDTTGDPWDARTLEWSLPSPAPHYNFARIPQIEGRDAWWAMKQKGLTKLDDSTPIVPIHMPKSSGKPFIMGVLFFVAGFGFVFNWFILAALGMVGVVILLFSRSFEYDTDYYVPVDEVKHTEALYGRS